MSDDAAPIPSFRHKEQCAQIARPVPLQAQIARPVPLAALLRNNKLF
jgi:hypothetical protein